MPRWWLLLSEASEQEGEVFARWGHHAAKGITMKLLLLILTLVILLSTESSAQSIGLSCDGIDTFRGKTDFTITFNEKEKWAIDLQYGIPGKMSASFSNTTISYSGNASGYAVDVTIDRVHAD